MNVEEIWQRALLEEIGLAIKCTDRELLRQQLYRSRLDGFTIQLPQEPDDEVWICHKSQESL